MEESKGNMTAMGVVYDNLLKYDLETTRRLTSLYALLYSDIAISDSWLMTNNVVQEMLSTRDGVELITQGIVTPLRRDTVATYRDFYNQSVRNKMHGLSAPKEEFLKLLDEPRITNRTRSFSLEQVSANYRNMSEQVLAPEVMANFGMSEQAIDRVQQRIQQAKSGKEPWDTNTFVIDTLCPLAAKESQQDANYLEELARAPYRLNLPIVLNIGVVGPDNFKGDQILSALGKEQRTIGSVDVKGQVADAAFKESIENPLIRWLLSDDTLQNLTAEELVICRSPEERKNYLEKLQVFLALPTQQGWDELIRELTIYLTKAAEDLFRHKGNNTDPSTEGEVVVEGGNIIKLIRPGKSVELTGREMRTGEPQSTSQESMIVQVQKASLNVIGKTVHLPNINNKKE